MGTGSEMPRINHNRMIVLELTIIGAYNYDAEGFGPSLCSRRAPCPSRPVPARH